MNPNVQAKRRKNISSPTNSKYAKREQTQTHTPHKTATWILFVPPFRLGLVRGKLFTGSVPCSAAESRATTAARCRARLEKELFCLAFKRALPDVIQFDMVVATGTSSRLGWTIPFAIQASWG